MSLTEKYLWYTKGIVKTNVDETLQEFFKTNPTQEQLLLLDKRNQTADMGLLVYTVLVLILGILLGIFFICLKYNITKPFG
jgi:hypothetical protein